MKKNIIDQLRKLIQKEMAKINTNFDETVGLQDNLDLIKKVFSNEEVLSIGNVDNKEYEQVLKLLVKEDEDELKKKAKAVKFLIDNDIELDDKQKDIANELSDRAVVLVRRLEKQIAKKGDVLSVVDTYRELDEELQHLQKSGYFTNDFLQKYFDILKITPERQDKMLEDIMRFNYERYCSAIGIKFKIDKLPKKENTNYQIYKEELVALFKKHGCDLSLLNDKLINSLMLKGDKEKIDATLESIQHSDIKFILEDSKRGKLLTQLLLSSNAELITETCKLFRENNISVRTYINVYKAVFFPSSEKDETEMELVHRRSGRESDSDEPHEGQIADDDLEVVGRNADFFQNLQMLKEVGQHDERELIANNVKVLTLRSTTLARRLKELELYEFPIQKSTFPLSTLSSSHIMELTDSYIELGEEKYILTYASRITAHTDGVIERIYALKTKGYPIYSSMGKGDKLIKYVTNLKLPCPVRDDELDAIIPKDVEVLLKGNKYALLLDKYLPSTISPETLEDPNIKRLDDLYKRSAWSYNFNGVIISRKKLLRNYEFLKKTPLIDADSKNVAAILLVSAIHNSILNTDNLQKVNDAIASSYDNAVKDNVSVGDIAEKVRGV